MRFSLLLCAKICFFLNFETQTEGDVHPPNIWRLVTSRLSMSSSLHNSVSCQPRAKTYFIHKTSSYSLLRMMSSLELFPPQAGPVSCMWKAAPDNVRSHFHVHHLRLQKRTYTLPQRRTQTGSYAFRQAHGGPNCPKTQILSIFGSRTTTKLYIYVIKP